MDWVTTNLGRDTRLAGVAANAATEAAEHGLGFNAATEAARRAWMEAAQQAAVETSRTPPPKVQHGPGLWIGFFGAIAGNVLLLILLSAVGNSLFNLVGDAAFTIQSLAPWILNIGALIALAVWPRGRRIVLGMLLAYAVALALVLVGAILLAVICFGGGAIGP